MKIVSDETSQKPKSHLEITLKKFQVECVVKVPFVFVLDMFSFLIPDTEEEKNIKQSKIMRYEKDKMKVPSKKKPAKAVQSNLRNQMSLTVLYQANCKKKK